MVSKAMKNGLLGAALAVVLGATFPTSVALAQGDAKDWPMYNRDVIGTRHNRGETAIDKATAGRLEEKWRFPAKGSGEQIGVIHATPIVVDGYLYFGTATDPTFYKLTPEGTVRWSYRRNPARPSGRGASGSGKSEARLYQKTSCTSNGVPRKKKMYA